MSERNKPIHFAALTWKNLEFIEQEAQHNPAVHAITQLALSLLGLIVVQHQNNHEQFTRKIRAQKLADLYVEGWPAWNFKPFRDGTTPALPKTLGELVEQLRHTIAHGLVTFSSDSRVHRDVVMSFNNKERGWCGEITAEDLREFCRRFKELLQAHDA